MPRSTTADPDLRWRESSCRGGAVTVEMRKEGPGSGLRWKWGRRKEGVRSGTTGHISASDLRPHPGVLLGGGHRVVPSHLPLPRGPSDSSSCPQTEPPGPRKAPLAREGAARPHCRAGPGRATCERQDSEAQGEHASRISRGPAAPSAPPCSNFPRTRGDVIYGLPDASPSSAEQRTQP